MIKSTLLCVICIALLLCACSALTPASPATARDTPTLAPSPTLIEMQTPTSAPTASPEPTAQPTSTLETTPYSAPEAEEYAVYSALIQAVFIDPYKDADRPELIVIDDETSLGPTGPTLAETLKFVQVDLPGLTDEVVQDFAARNQQTYPLEPLLTLSVKNVLISQEELNTIFKNQDGWDIFYSKFPNSQGRMTLSCVGFNPEKDMALVYVGNQSYWLAGAGFYVLLEKVAGQWIVKSKTITWIS